MDSNGVVKLTDFGIARVLDSTGAADTYTGTVLYMSPERLQHGSYSQPCDIWSMGVLAVELWEKQFPFPCSEFELLPFLLEKLSLGELFSHSKYPSDNMATCLAGMLSRDPDERVTAASVTMSPWMAELGIQCCFEGVLAAQSILREWLAELQGGQMPPSSTTPDLEASGKAMNLNMARIEENDEELVTPVSQAHRSAADGADRWDAPVVSARSEPSPVRTGSAGRARYASRWDTQAETVETYDHGRTNDDDAMFESGEDKGWNNEEYFDAKHENAEFRNGRRVYK